MDQQIIDYIKKSRELGHSDSDIKTLLLNAGHKEEDVRAAFDTADGKNVIPPPPSFSSNHPSYGNSSIELPGPIVLLKSAWQIYKARFWSLLSLYVLPILVLGGLITIFALLTLMFPTLSPVVLVFISLLLFIPFAIVSLRSAVALIFAIVAPQPVGVFEAFKISKGKALSFFWVGLLMGLVMMGGFVMLIVPGFIFLAWFSLSQFIFVAEGHKGFSALLKSKEYVNGNLGKVFLRLLFIVVINILVSLVIKFGIGLISETVAGVVSGLFSLLSAPLWFAYTFSLYQALRAKKPELISQPVSGRKGLLIFSAILGPIILITSFLIVMTLIYYEASKF